MKELRGLGYEIKQVFPGIYYIGGSILFPIQIVVTNRVEPEEHAYFIHINDILINLSNRRITLNILRIINRGDVNPASHRLRGKGLTSPIFIRV